MLIKKIAFIILTKNENENLDKIENNF